MKNVIIMLLAMSLLSPVPGSAEQSCAVRGLVTERTEDGFALLTDEGIRFIITSFSTQWDTEGDPEIGDHVTVYLTGPTDRKSLNAQTVTCHALYGEVLEIRDGPEPFFLLLPEGENDPVKVDFGGLDPASIAQGMPVTVYYSGIMTRSVPPVITADYIRGLTIQGIIVTADSSSLLLMEGCSPAYVHVTENTLVLTPLIPASSVTVTVTPTMTLSIPPQYTAVEILPVK